MSKSPEELKVLFKTITADMVISTGYDPALTELWDEAAPNYEAGMAALKLFYDTADRMHHYSFGGAIRGYMTTFDLMERFTLEAVGAIDDSAYFNDPDDIQRLRELPDGQITECEWTLGQLTLAVTCFCTSMSWNVPSAKCVGETPNITTLYRVWAHKARAGGHGQWVDLFNHVTAMRHYASEAFNIIRDREW